MRLSMLTGLALGAVAGAVLVSSNADASEAFEKGKCGFMQKMKKLKSIMQ